MCGPFRRSIGFRFTSGKRCKFLLQSWTTLSIICRTLHAVPVIAAVNYRNFWMGSTQIWTRNQALGLTSKFEQLFLCLERRLHKTTKPQTGKFQLTATIYIHEKSPKRTSYTNFSMAMPYNFTVRATRVEKNRMPMFLWNKKPAQLLSTLEVIEEQCFGTGSKEWTG